MEEVIYRDDEIIGNAEDIEADIKCELHRGTIDDVEIAYDLLNELKGHTGLVTCWYHPMGAWYIREGAEL